MRIPASKPFRRLSAVLFGAVIGVLNASATDYYFSGTNSLLYRDAGNWTPTGVPDLTSANTAHISGNFAVNYEAGPDLIIRNGGVLEIAAGSFTQTLGPAYLQLNGGGSILISGGTFDQGTSTSGPFNVSGTGNVFNMTSGAANFNHGFSVSTGLTSILSGGTLTTTGGGTTINSSLTLSGANAALGDSLQLSSTGTLLVSGGSVSTSGQVTNAGALSIANATVNTGKFVNNGTFSMSSGTLTTTGEFNFNNNQNTLSGGTINTTLITGVNGGAGNHVFNISGGALTLSSGSFNGIYGGGTTQYINFTAGSTGYIEFLASTNNTIASVRGFISNNVIEYDDNAYNAATGYANFSITQDASGNVFLSLANVAVPEPATVAAGGLLALCAAPMVVRRLRRRSFQQAG